MKSKKINTSHVLSESGGLRTNFNISFFPQRNTSPPQSTPRRRSTRPQLSPPPTRQLCLRGRQTVMHNNNNRTVGVASSSSRGSKCDMSRAPGTFFFSFSILISLTIFIYRCYVSPYHHLHHHYCRVNVSQATLTRLTKTAATAAAREGHKRRFIRRLRPDVCFFLSLFFVNLLIFFYD